MLQEKFGCPLNNGVDNGSRLKAEFEEQKDAEQSQFEEEKQVEVEKTDREKLLLSLADDEFVNFKEGSK